MIGPLHGLKNSTFVCQEIWNSFLVTYGLLSNPHVRLQSGNRRTGEDGVHCKSVNNG